MTGTTLLIVILVFAGLAKSQQLNPSKAKIWFIAAAILAVIGQVIAPVHGRPMDPPDLWVFWEISNAVFSVSLLLAWFGAWKVLTEE